MKRLVCTVSFVLAAATPLLAQRPTAPTASIGAEKQATALRIDNGAIRVDGRLDDEAWTRAMAIADFTQKEPTEGAAPSEAMDVRFVFDESALYIGARMRKRPGTPIQAPMGRRDRFEQSEHVLIALDTFLDRRTAYVFGVTAAGVRIDRFHAKDDEATFDETYEPVWQAKTDLGADEWTAELWIPFSQLRFNDQADMVWGLNVRRYTPTFNEDDYWVAIPRTMTAWSSQFGTLHGIQRLTSTRRFELLPYTAGSSTINGNRNPANPFDDGRNLKGRVGADLKLGLGPNLTLDATINPDFGQVEADAAEVNLSAFETQFTEKRPFFIEGANLMNLALTNNFFYSRRIGARPTARVTGDFIDYPSTTAILGAAKLTGRLPSGTSLGMLAAVTGEESAQTFSRITQNSTKVRVAPRTTWSLARVQREFGAAGSTVSGLTSIVHRDLDSSDPLASLLSRTALAAGGDALLRFKGGEYEWTSFVGSTYVKGDAPAIAGIQRNSVHFAQRPDRSYARYDPTLTALTGFKTGTNFAKRGGRHWIWNVTNQYESPNFEPNDIGRLTSGDSKTVNLDVRYRETRPRKGLRSYWVGLTQENEWNWENGREIKQLAFYTSQTWTNFWTSEATYTNDFKRLNTRLTRGGPTMEAPAGWTMNAKLKNSASAQTGWSVDLTTARTEDSGFTNKFIGHVAFRPGPRWQVSADPTFQRQVDPQQYITTIDGGRAETFGRRYVFGNIDRSTYSTQFRVSLTFKPDMTLDVYAEPFAASGSYHDIGELRTPGTSLRREYGEDGTSAITQADGSLLVTDGSATFKVNNVNFNVHSFRSNVVLKWEYRPGSLLFLVWQQDRRLEEPTNERIGFGSPYHSLTIPGNNSFVVKTTFWLPVN